MNMRIGYIIPEFPGQTHIFFWREINALREMGVEVEVVSTRKPPANLICHAWSEQAITEAIYLMPMGPIALFSVLWTLVKTGPRRVTRCIAIAIGDRQATWAGRTRALALLPFAGRLASIVRRRGYQHLHAHSCANAVMLALFVKVLCDVPYSMTLHGPLTIYKSHQRAKWQHARFAITVTNRLKREVLDLLPQLKQEKIDIAPMGVDLNVFQRDKPYVAPVADEPWRIVSCGRLHRAKGHQDLIEALGLLRDRGVKATLTVLGEGPAHQMLEERIRDLKLEQQAKLRGAVSEAEVRDALAESHLFALASHDEAIGVATMEAMAMGLPVVVTDVGGVRELVHDGIDGLLVAPKSPNRIAQAIEKIVANPECAKIMGMAGARRVKQHFGSDRSARIIWEHLGCAGTNTAEDADRTPSVDTPLPALPAGGQA